MLLSTSPSLPVKGSGSQPGQYTGAPTRFASFCHAAGLGHAGFASFCAAAAGFASLPQPETTTERPRSRHNVTSTRTAAIVARELLNGNRLVADELAHVLGADEHCVHPSPLECEHLVAVCDVDLGDRELPRRHVGKQLEHGVERVDVLVDVVRIEEKDLWVEPFERESELLLVANVD